MSTNNPSLAMQRISKLVDENSFMEIGSLVTARSTDFNLAGVKTPSDGVITGHGLVNGSLVFVYSQDASVLNGTVGEMHAKKIAKLYDDALCNIPWITAPASFVDRKMVYQTYHTLLDSSIDRSKLIAYLKENGVETNYGAQALHLLSCYQSGHTSEKQNMANSADAYLHGLALPMGGHISENELIKIVSLLRNYQN